MCGFFSKFGHLSFSRTKYLEISKKLRHRGPDWNGIYMEEKSVICHERLSIVGVDDGSQPLVSEDGNIILSVNGEIYNYKELFDVVLQNKYTPKTKSDCEVIIYLYKELGPKFINMLDGIFSFVLYDKESNTILCARDPIGIIPLYMGVVQKDNEDNEIQDSISFASEMKCLDYCDTIFNFKPGNYLEININNIIAGTYSLSEIEQLMVQYYNPNWKNKQMSPYIKNIETHDILKDIRNSLTDSVKKRLMADVPFGVLLSGGLDSSLIASITSRLIQENNVFSKNLHSFSIGLTGSPDLIAARKVADFLGCTHHELNFTVQDGIDCIKDLIYYLETYDVTTIRASTPMFLLSRKIKSYGIKMVLSGEGADEIFGGYLYFHKSPNSDEFHNECIKRVNDLNKFDCLRANKSTMAWGLEARVPFLDKRFLELCMPIHPHNKLNRIEKYVLRKAFDTPETPYLPQDILWRQKEQFTDGVGYNWLDTLVRHCEDSITDLEFESRKNVYNVKNKEELFYKNLFLELFPGRGEIVDRWVPKTDWDGVSYDPSGRAQTVHVSNN